MAALALSASTAGEYAFGFVLKHTQSESYIATYPERRAQGIVLGHRALPRASLRQTEAALQLSARSLLLPL